jgi:hypothetical protein
MRVLGGRCFARTREESSNGLIMIDRQPFGVFRHPLWCKEGSSKLETGTRPPRLI